MFAGQFSVGILLLEPVIVAGMVWAVYKVLLHRFFTPRHALIFLHVGALLSFLSFFLEYRTLNNVFPLYYGELFVRPFTLSLESAIYEPLNALHTRLSASLGFPAVYFLIFVVMLTFVGVQLWWLHRLVSCSHAESWQEGFRVYRTSQEGAFSFGRSIFLPAGLQERHRLYVLNHELGHVKGAHFAQLVALRAVLCLQWYNPFMWLLIREVKQLHEFEADAYALSREGVDAADYQFCLVEQATQCAEPLSLRQNFKNSSLKQRILYMKRKQYPRRSALWLGVFLVVLLVGAAFVVSLRAYGRGSSEASHPLKGFYRRIDTRGEVYFSGKMVNMFNEQLPHYYKAIGDTTMVVMYFPDEASMLAGNCVTRIGTFEYLSSTHIRENGGQTTHPIQILDDEHFTMQYTALGKEEKVDSVVVTELWERIEVPEYCRVWADKVL